MGEAKALDAGSLLDLLFEDPRVGRCLVAPDGRVLRASREWLRSTGLTLEGAVGADVVELLPGARDSALGMLALARAGQRVELPGRARRVEGRETWWEGTLEPVAMSGWTGLLLTAREVAVDPAPQDGSPAPSAGEARFREIADESPAILWVTDAQGDNEFVNRRYRDFFGVTLEQVRGMKWRPLVHPEDSPRYLEAVLTAIRERAPFSVEARVRRQDGEWRWISSYAQPHRGERGEFLGHVGFSLDITERRRADAALREAEERFRALVQGVKDCAIYMLAPDGTVTSWSTAAEEMYGYREEEIVGQHRALLFTEEDRRADVPRRELEEAEAHGRCEDEGWRVRKDGSRFWANVLIAALRDDAGHMRGFASVHRDFTERRRSEAALRESEERYRSLFDHMSEGLAYCRMIFDGDRPVDFVYLDVNPAFEVLTGLKGVVGKKVSEVIPGLREAEPDLIETYGRVARQGTPERFETFLGSLGHWLSISVYSPAPGDFVAVFDVITERKRAQDELRESEGKLRLAKDAAKMGAWNWDLLTGEATWSDRCKALFGLPPETVLTWQVFQDAIHPEDRDRIGRAVNDALTKQEPYDVEMRVLRPDGTVGWVASRGEVSYAPDGRPVRMDGMVMDVTERKAAEAAAREANEQLREADRQKDRFLATLSHELRNPLAPIRNSLYILDRAAPGGEQARRAQAIIHRQVGQLTWLIDDLLDITRISHGKVQLQRERLDLNELAHHTVEDHRTAFVRSDVRLEVLPAPTEVWILGDRVRLAQVVGNLLQNAAKFTPRGGKVTVSIEPDPARGRAVLAVRDTGSGITPEMLPRLFHPFTQADATLDRSKGGLGLGLALVKGLVELHGGSVSAASGGPGKGSTFTVSLPLEAAAARGTPAGRGAEGDGAPRRVLVIEDNEDAADTLREVLELEEHVVEVAYDGREGLQRARAFQPDVVLCDIGLPGMDGYQVARQLRADPELGRVGLIAVSGYAQPEDVAAARAAGFEVHLAKPPSLEALERALVEVGSARQAEH
jgi:PAS domain S-box-containing protein